MKQKVQELRNRMRGKRKWSKSDYKLYTELQNWLHANRYVKAPVFHY